MQSVFIRHKLVSTSDILRDLWTKRLIAVHYGDIRSTDPEKYNRAGKAALSRLWKYCSSGAVVGATFTFIRPTDMIVGEIKKGSRVELTQYHNFIYKTVQLQNAQEISLRDHPLLGAIRPRYAAVTGWPSARKYLEAILKNKSLPRTVNSLAPSQLEVICHEYLRMQEGLDALLLPIGRTLRDIDIYGIDQKNGNIIAQVTQSGSNQEIESKVNKLKAYQAPNTKLIFFGPESRMIEDPLVTYIPVEKVFEAVDTIRPQLISRLLAL
jgi:hypothetical protein